MSTHSLCPRKGGEVTISTKKQPPEKYQRILDAAIKVFAEQGFFQATISQIAREAGVADGTIYLYFKNKDDILTQIFKFKTQRVFNRFREEVENTSDSIDKLKALIRRHLDEFQRDRNMAIVYQAETHQAFRMAESEIREMSKLYRDIVSEILEQGQAENRLRKDLYVGLVQRLIIGAVDEVINTWLHSGGQYDLSSMADPLVELIIRGIGNQE
jgi:TetR/AcrR family fatty acid metabolism transcriptional regulator